MKDDCAELVGLSRYLLKRNFHNVVIKNVRIPPSAIETEQVGGRGGARGSLLNWVSPTRVCLGNLDGWNLLNFITVEDLKDQHKRKNSALDI